MSGVEIIAAMKKRPVVKGLLRCLPEMDQERVWWGSILMGVVHGNLDYEVEVVWI